MDLRQLEYFVAVAEELSFTRAAARCHVVQSALSYQVARLERENGVMLFERTSRSVRLAPAGELLLPRARRDPRRARRGADAELAELAGVLTGRLRLGHDRQHRPGRPGSGARAGRVPPPPPRRRDRRPGHRQRGTWPSRCAPATRSGLRRACSPTRCRPIWSHRLLAAEPLVAVVAARPPARRPRAVELADTRRGTAFVEMRAESGLRRQVDAAFARAGVTRPIAFELSTSEARRPVRRARLRRRPSCRARRSPPHPRMSPSLELADPGARHPIGLVHRHPAPSAPSARAFLTLLAASTDV